MYRATDERDEPLRQRGGIEARESTLRDSNGGGGGGGARAQ